jgi:hypothetical protein
MVKILRGYNPLAKIENFKKAVQNYKMKSKNRLNF